MSIKRATVFLLPVFWFVMACSVAAQEPVKYSGFAVRVSNGALPPPHNRNQEISATFGVDRVAINYERTDGAKSRKWKTIWKGDRYRRSRNLVQRTQIQQPQPGRVPMVGGGVFDVTLRAQGGKTRTGKAVNQAEWKNLVDTVDREAQAAWKKAPPPKNRTPARASSGAVTGTARDFYNKGGALYAAGRFDEAISAYREAVRLRPGWAEAHYALGRAYDKLKLWPESVRAYRQAARLKPRYAEAYIGLGWALEEQRRYPDALTAFRNAIRVRPNSADAYYGLSYVYGDMGRWQDTIGPLRQAIRHNPKYVKAYVSLSYTYSQLTRWQEAVEAARQAARIEPRNVSAHSNLGWSLVRLGRYPEAVRAYSEAVRLSPKDVDLYNSLGDAQFKAGQYQEALATFQTAARLDPKNGTTYANLGTTYERLGQKEKSLETLRQAVQIDPNQAGAHNNLAHAYKGQGRRAEAEAAYRTALRAAGQALRRDPENSDAYFQQGYAYSGLGQWPSAFQAYTKGLRFAPGDSDAYRRRALAYLFSGRGDLAAASDAQAYLRRVDWRDEHAPYMAIIASLGYRHARRERSGLRMLDEAARGLNANAWPYQVIRYLQGALPAKELLARATDNDKMTEARAYIGTDLLLTGFTAEAREHLRWVVENGNRTFIEYDLAVAELRRAEKQRSPRASSGEGGA